MSPSTSRRAPSAASKPSRTPRSGLASVRSSAYSGSNTRCSPVGADLAVDPPDNLHVLLRHRRPSIHRRGAGRQRLVAAGQTSSGCGTQGSGDGPSAAGTSVRRAGVNAEVLRARVPREHRNDPGRPPLDAPRAVSHGGRWRVDEPDLHLRRPPSGLTAKKTRFLAEESPYRYLFPQPGGSSMRSPGPVVVVGCLFEVDGVHAPEGGASE